LLKVHFPASGSTGCENAIHDQSSVGAFYKRKSAMIANGSKPALSHFNDISRKPPFIGVLSGRR